MKILNKTFVILFLVIVSFPLISQEDSVETKPKFMVSGYADAYYNLSFQNPGAGAKLWGPAAGSRAFDINNNQFSLGMVQGKFTYTTSKVDIVADLIAGPNATLATVANFKSAAWPNGLGGGTLGIKQLYGAWKATDKLTFTIGAFGTHIGYELIEPTLNFNYSLSNLFNNGPFFHTGLKANYAISDKVGLMVGLVNNWDNFDENNGFKSPIFQLSLLPVDGLSIYLNAIMGKGDVAGTLNPEFGKLNEPNSFNTRLLDLVAIYTVGKVTFGVNAASGAYTGSNSDAKNIFKGITKNEKTSPTWGGIAGYFNVAASDNFSIGTRIEQFNDYYGVRYIGAKNTSLTFTGSITCADGSLILKPEFRFDSSKGKNNVNGHVDKYNDKDGTTDVQQTLGMSAIFKF